MHNDLFFEDIIAEESMANPELREVKLSERPVRFFTFLLFLVLGVVAIRLISLAASSAVYSARAAKNLNLTEYIPAPRALIVDRAGKILADNRPVFSLLLNTKEFLRSPELAHETTVVLKDSLNMDEDALWALIREKNSSLKDFTEPVVLSLELDTPTAVHLKSLHLPSLVVLDAFKRNYREGSVFSSVLGYTGFINADELVAQPALEGEEVIGKSGIELAYDETLRGTSGSATSLRNAKGEIIGEGERHDPQATLPLTLTIDSEFQSYFYQRMVQGLETLGRTSGVAIALNPQNGEILAMMSFPSFDNNVFMETARSGERKELLTSPLKPLFNRAVSGNYSPGSTIKPLVGVAALSEGVINPTRTVFSPGYLDIPNPYNPDKPTRYLDWRYQGNVDLAAAIAQSSDVYFYEVGGGFGDIKGIGISKLKSWWQRFGFGARTNIQFPSEAKGFLPDPDWKEKNKGTPWLLGDTYNVSIGQGDLLTTPLQLINYTASIANGGKLYRPKLVKNESSNILQDLSPLFPQIQEVGRGMRQAVTAPLGTAYSLHDLPFSVAAKTGSAQVKNNTEENAFFVGYIDNPKTPGASSIVILILVEHSKEGSLNALPIAKDVLNWYYKNRLQTSL